jgi:hypothetical protein
MMRYSVIEEKKAYGKVTFKDNNKKKAPFVLP